MHPAAGDVARRGLEEIRADHDRDHDSRKHGKAVLLRRCEPGGLVANSRGVAASLALQPEHLESQRVSRRL
jgi:hypothetical protein